MSGAEGSLGPCVRRTAWPCAAKQGLFRASLTIYLLVPSLTSGPLNWLPMVRLGVVDGVPLALGPLSLVPVLALIAWAVARIVERPARPWHWGRPGITLPLAGLTLLMILSLDPALIQRTLKVLLILGVLWWVYLFVINEAPNLTLSLTFVLLVQGLVALAQFVLQHEVGLAALGEPVLNPEVSGICVLFARGRRWLRAYGLSGHPNLLGALLAVLLLYLIGKVVRADGSRWVWLTLASSVGLLGMLAAFSRSAWLAFCVGLVAWSIWEAIRHRSRGQEGIHALAGWRAALRQHVHLAIPVLVVLVFLLLHHDLVASRFLHLETPIESRSIADRQVDANLALQLIREHPWRGVGVRNYLVAVRAIEPDSRIVHNVPLLVAAELGLPGAALWLWLALAGLTRLRSPAWAPWIASLVVGSFDVALFPTNNWYATVVFGLVTAQLARPRRLGTTRGRSGIAARGSAK